MTVKEYPKNLFDDLFKYNPLKGFEWNVTEELLIKIEHAFSFLPERESAVLRLRYQEGRKFAEIGNYFGISTSRASDICFNAIQRIHWCHLTDYFIGETEYETVKDEDIRNQPIRNLNIADYACDILMQRRIRTIGELVQYIYSPSIDPADWCSNIRSIGKTEADHIIDELIRAGVIDEDPYRERLPKKSEGEPAYTFSEMEEIKKMYLVSLGLPTEIYNFLYGYGVRTIRDLLELVCRPDWEREINEIGPKRKALIEIAIKEHGLL